MFTVAVNRKLAALACGAIYTTLIYTLMLLPEQAGNVLYSAERNIHIGQYGIKAVHSGHGLTDNQRYVVSSRHTHTHVVVPHGGSKVNHFLCVCDRTIPTWFHET